jgi:thiol-disulfide isomerase/thioredoxin
MAISMTTNQRRLLTEAVTIFVACLCVVGVSIAARADNIKDFGTQSFEQIKSEYEGEPFVLSLWSIDCAPCRVELKLLGELKKEDPSFPLVVISTDSIENREEAADILDSYALQSIETWMFADAFVERLRYSVDPLWHGELPRSYFFKSDHSFEAHSGVLSRAQLAKFFPGIEQ